MQEPMPGVLRTDPKQVWKDKFVVYFEVEKGGIITLDQLYMFMHQWFKKEQYTSASTGDDRIEDFYLHRIRPDGAQENLIWWRSVRKLNRFIYYFCKTDWQVFGAKETEIEYNGKKIKTDKVGLVIRVWWWVQIDPSNLWEKSFLGNITEWFYEYLMDDEIENHEEKVRQLAKRMENEIKAFFEMTTTIPMPRTFFPEEGYKWDRPKPKSEDFENLKRAPDQKI